MSKDRKQYRRERWERKTKYHKQDKRNWLKRYNTEKDDIIKPEERCEDSDTEGRDENIY